MEQPFILKALEHFGFGEHFQKVIGMLYDDINSSVLLTLGACKRFEARRGFEAGVPSFTSSLHYGYRTIGNLDKAK